MYSIYLVPHSHYDAVWAFTKEDYLYINIEQILKPAIELMEKSDYRFLMEQTALLEEIERRNPSIFAELKKFIKQGKLLRGSASLYIFGLLHQKCKGSGKPRGFPLIMPSGVK